MKRPQQTGWPTLARLGWVMAALLLPSSTHAQSFTPRYILPGTLRIWGDPAMTSIVLSWEERFRLYHPEVTFQNQLLGTDTGMGALYTGIADLALLGREANQTESDGFLHSLQYTPTSFPLLTGSLDALGQSPAPAFLVAALNPIAQLTHAQAVRALGNAQPAARTWGDLGVTGPWASHPLHVYTFDLESGTGLFLLNKLQGPSKKMNWSAVREFRDRRNDDGSVLTSAQQTAAAVLADPDGLAVSTLRNAGPGLKALPFDGIALTRATLLDHTYPLTRTAYVFLNRSPGQPFPQPAAEFLRFVFSPEGQDLIPTHTGFLPLTPGRAAQTLLLLSADN